MEKCELVVGFEKIRRWADFKTLFILLLLYIAYAIDSSTCARIISSKERTVENPFSSK